MGGMRSGQACGCRDSGSYYVQARKSSLTLSISLAMLRRISRYSLLGTAIHYERKKFEL